MKLIRLSLVLFCISMSFIIYGQTGLHAQTGVIRGVIINDATGETMPGVNVIIDGTTTGSVTDLDGKFNLTVEPGTYSIKMSFVSYETVVINNVVVKDNDVTSLNNIRLKETVNQLSQVVITADMVRNNENAMLTMKRRSANLIDGISADNFKKIGDSDVGASIKRVPGVSVTGGKYVYVRGLGDRYTKTILNGVDIPGLDPDRNTLQMDLFPTNIIDNVIVHKSFVAELPADFTGGVIDITIKDFPEKKTGTFSLSTAYNPNFHFNRNYLTYEGGKTDFLGFDDGTRDIPNSNTYFFSDAISDVNSQISLSYKEVLQNFNPIMAAKKDISFLDYGFGFDYANQVVKSRLTLGYNFMLSYKNETEFYENAQYSRFGLADDRNVNELEIRELQTGNYGVNNILLSGLAGFAIKTQNSKYRINLMHLQNGESKAGIFDYVKTDQGTEFSALQHNLDYNQRSLSNVLISGKHNFNSAGWDIEWKLSPTYSQIDDPDIRFTRYEIRNDSSYYIGTEAGFPERIWRELDELNLAGILNNTKEFKLFGESAKFKFGGAYTYKTRDFIIRGFSFEVPGVPLTGDPDEIFSPENLWPVNGNLGTHHNPNFLPVNPNKYNANVANIAGYISTEFTPIKRFKTIIGLRVEGFRQKYTGQDQLGYKKLDDDVVLDEIDFFPTINLNYSLNEKHNLRLSYTQTIARPSMKEISYSEIYDPITGRTFIGGLFRDEDYSSGVIYWDGNLKSTDITNYDFRWEFFPAPGQTISAGAFYKKLINPIEIVQFISQAGSFQPRNVGDGQITGAEIEVRQSMKLISDALSNFGVVFNFTLIESQIKLSKTEYESRLDNARTGQDVGEYREMAGQAPHLINAGVIYNGNEKAFWNGFEAGLYYHVQGKALQYVGIADRPDIYSNPFHSLNLNANKRFGKDKRMQFGIKVDNILNAKIESVFSSYNSSDKYFTRLEPGTKYQLRFGYNIF